MKKEEIKKYRLAGFKILEQIGALERFHTDRELRELYYSDERIRRALWGLISALNSVKREEGRAEVIFALYKLRWGAVYNACPISIGGVWHEGRLVRYVGETQRSYFPELADIPEKWKENGIIIEFD